MDANHVTEPHAEDVILAVSLELAVGKWKVARFCRAKAAEVVFEADKYALAAR